MKRTRILTILFSRIVAYLIQNHIGNMKVINCTLLIYRGPSLIFYSVPRLIKVVRILTVAAKVQGV